eukprot:TRINITY_DN2514_c0_g1_i1.p1 TRINITY_DN2514_c0_g1~~TRINITY_DN2514_c0_g1_i1.p1  ORF type:complete len:391 (-),score=145.60 TRINITY_DN2514_c0_g1_i1:199-1371(-)
MPLIVMVGPPASGKTTRAKELKEYFTKVKGKEVVIVNEESCKIIKNVGYKDSKEEKNTRSTLRAGVERTLNNSVVVIFDSMNYIKGFRYEMFCTAREYGTAHCLVYCDTPIEKAKIWNLQRENKFSEQLLEELFMRMEVPNSNNRWDRPLFEIYPPNNEEEPQNSGEIELDPSFNFDDIKLSIDDDDDDDDDEYNQVATVTKILPDSDSDEEPIRFEFSPNVKPVIVNIEESDNGEDINVVQVVTLENSNNNDEENNNQNDQNKDEDILANSPLPFDDIYDAIFKRKGYKQSFATKPTPQKSTNFVHELDKMTKAIIDKIISEQQTFIPGDTINVPHTTELVILNKKISPAKLRRIRRQFIKITQLNPPKTLDDIGISFVGYLNSNFEQS